MVDVRTVDRAGIGEFSRVVEVEVGEACHTRSRQVRRNVAQELVYAQTRRQELDGVHL